LPFRTRLTVASLTPAYAATSAKRRVIEQNVVGFADGLHCCAEFRQVLASSGEIL